MEELLDAAHRTKLIARRGALGLTQSALAGQVGVSRQMICMIESGAKQPSRDLLSRMAAALGLRLELRKTKVTLVATRPQQRRKKVKR